MTLALTEADRRSLRARLATRLTGAWRTRFAPAPTGQLHLGHAVNAVWVWSIARAFDGSVLVRIEDHDRQRSRATFDQQILEDLDWLGLAADNDRAGEPFPIRQSDRAAAYDAALGVLTASGQVYACACSRREIAALGAGSGELRYPGTCRSAAVPAESTPARRLRVKDDQVTFEDLRHGWLAQRPADQCGDLLLRDRLGQWTYQFAVVVDDQAQEVDLIIRGDDLLESTGRQRLLAEALGASGFPQTLHHPLVLKPDGSKLSKSSGDTSLAELRGAGWSAAQVLGEAAWLGGLQATSTPIEPSALATLWRRD